MAFSIDKETEKIQECIKEVVKALNGLSVFDAKQVLEYARKELELNSTVSPRPQSNP